MCLDCLRFERMVYDMKDSYNERLIQVLSSISATFTCSTGACNLNLQRHPVINALI